MGRKRKKAILDVYIGSNKIGNYARSSNGTISFRYVPDWISSDKAFPISLSMPLSDRIWSGVSVSSFFAGLLPDDPTIRDKIATREHTDSSEPFDLLSAIGRDCIGALRFIPEGFDPGDPTKMDSRPVSDDEIAERIAALTTTPLGIQISADNFRISIAGMQEKTAFLQIDNQWHLPLGATPSSHIFKPAMKGRGVVTNFSNTPWNEWLCLELCRAFGLESAQADVLMFDEKPIIVVERFDRLWRDNILYRLPQEDLCQALGFPPTRKYQNDSGPGIIEILDFLNGSAVPRQDRLSFMKAQIVFWLLAAIDGHAKNFSIFLTPGGYKLTPLYDVMSAAPFPDFSDHKIKLAMAVGNKNHYRLKEIQLRHFYQTGQKAGLHKQDIDEIFSGLSSQADDVIATVNSLSMSAGVPKSTSEPIFTDLTKRIKLIRII